MGDISNSVIKKDHGNKAGGYALYVDDLKLDGMLHGRILRSTKAKARLEDVVVPELPAGYFYIDKRDVTGINEVHIILEDTPVFADGAVEFAGDPIGMVVGEDLKEVDRIISEIIVVYEEMTPILDVKKSDTIFFEYSYVKGDMEKALSDADRIITKTYETGYQEQAYLETQGMIALPNGDKITVRGSMQCPYYVHTAVKKVLGHTNEKVQIIQDVTGGGFGGKEAYPSLLACQVAVAAKKVNRPVKVIFERREDMEFTSKRHPAICTYKAAMKGRDILGMDIDVIYNGGAYTTLSAVVLQRGLICSSGVYRIDNLHVHGRVLKTNTVPGGAYRGFGAPQTFFAMEMMMIHLAKEVGESPLSFKKRYLVKQGDSTATNGKFHFHVPIPKMIERINELTDYENKYEKYKNQTGRYRRGIGMSLFFHGCGFTGSGERDLIKAIVRLRKNEDDSVEILASSTDMGQGVKTTFCKIVADVLGIPLEQVYAENPDTDRVPDSGPTAASRSIMVVGGLLKKAAEHLKEEWKPGIRQVVEERFKEPDFVIPFDINTFQGDAYPDYSWAVNVLEVEVDKLTAETKILGAWGIYDVGMPIDMNIIQGQMQGGFLQGIGYASMEFMNYNEKGVIRNNSFSDYIIPTAVDVPNMVTEIINNPSVEGPYGAKGAGELPTVGPAAAYIEAMEQAVGADVCKIPFTQEEILKVLQEVEG